MVGRKFSHLKGQSAIEYLTTYGWMLLVVAIVGGAIFTTIQNQSNLKNVEGFTSDAVGIDTFALRGDGSLGMVLESQGQEPVKVTNVSMRNTATGNEAYASSSGLPTEFIPLGESSSANITGVTQGSSNNDYGVNITYDTRDLSGLQATGTITGSFDLG